MLIVNRLCYISVSFLCVQKMGRNRHLTFLLLVALSCNTFPRIRTHPPRAGQQSLKPLDHSSSGNNAADTLQKESEDSRLGRTRTFKEFLGGDVDSTSVEGKSKTSNHGNEIVATEASSDISERNYTGPAHKNNNSNTTKPAQERVSMELQTDSLPVQTQKRSFGLEETFQKRSGRLSNPPLAIREALMRRIGIKRVPLVDRMPFGYGKRAAMSTDQPEFLQGSDELGVFNADTENGMSNAPGALDKRDRLGRMAFAYGKRSSDGEMEPDGFLRRSVLDRMPSGYGKRADNYFDESIDEDEIADTDKRDRLGRMAFAYGKRTSLESEELDDDDDDIFTELLDTDKRNRLDRMPTGYGKRTSLEDIKISAIVTNAAKRARLDRLASGYGKRSLPDVAPY